MNTAADRHYRRLPGYEHYAQNPMQQLFDKWLDKRRASVKDSSIRAYITMLNDVVAFMKGRPIEEFDQEKALKLVNYLLNVKKLNPNVVRAKLEQFRFVLNYGLEEGIITKLPFSFKKLPRIRPAKIDKMPFTYEQYTAVRSELAKEQYRSFWPDACAIGWHTGIRVSDVANIKRGLVDLTGNVIIVRTIKKSALHEEVEIPIEPDLRPVIERLLATPKPYETEFLLPDMEFQYRENRQRVTQAFRLACDACGLPRHSFHSLRHAFVSRLLNAGIDSIVISSITGQSIKQIQEYAHVTREAKFAAMARSRGEGQVKVIEL